MKKYLEIGLTVLIVGALIAVSIIFGQVTFSALQLETLMVVGIICGVSVVYCFVVGEISRNNSQMDKLWSITPIIYAWVIAAKGGMSPRLIVMAILITLWGIRLTSNFARKGAYSIKFWSGKEDYRWVVLRQNKYLKNKFVWAIFDLLFISTFQNVLVLAITFPMIAVMESTAVFGVIDIIVTVIAFGFIALETIADEQQMRFYNKRGELLKEFGSLDKCPAPYNKGFNTTGLWGRSRHPNYFSEQAFWFTLFFFTVGAGVNNYYVFNWTFVGALVLILLFLGSSQFGEGVSSSKYKEYSNYCKKTSKYIPLWKYKD